MARLAAHLANAGSGNGPGRRPHHQDTGALGISPRMAWLLQPRRRAMRIRTTSHLLLQDGSILGERCRRVVPRHIHLGAMDSGRRLGNVSGARAAASGASETFRAVKCGFAPRDDTGLMTEARAD